MYKVKYRNKFLDIKLITVQPTRERKRKPWNGIWRQLMKKVLRRLPCHQQLNVTKKLNLSGELVVALFNLIIYNSTAGG